MRPPILGGADGAMLGIQQACELKCGEPHRLCLVPSPDCDADPPLVQHTSQTRSTLVRTDRAPGEYHDR
jgi:hypothetical protein